MTNQEVQLKLNALKLAHQKDFNTNYQRSEAYSQEYQAKYKSLTLRQRKESADLEYKHAFSEQDPRSDVYQLKAFYKIEMNDFVNKSRPEDPKYKMKLISLKLKQKTELVGYKRRIEEETTRLYVLHKSELDALATELDYKCKTSAEEKGQLNIRYDIERKALINAFMYANKKYKVGDVLSDQKHSISVRWFSCGKRWLASNKDDNTLDVSYGGYILDKNGEFRPDGATGSVWQSDVINVH